MPVGRLRAEGGWRDGRVRVGERAVVEDRSGQRSFQMWVGDGMCLLCS